VTRRALGWVPRALGHPLNVALGLVLLVVLVVLPLAGVNLSTGAQLVGGNFMNAISYLGASIAAGASVTHLVEGRKHRADERKHREQQTRHLTAIRAHLTAGRPAQPPRGDLPE
jgi:hypothetical protein